MCEDVLNLSFIKGVLFFQSTTIVKTGNIVNYVWENFLLTFFH